MRLAAINGAATPKRSSQAPAAALVTNSAIDSTRRCQCGELPPAQRDSAIRPARVSVSTLVAMSGTPCLRISALWMPMAKASSATIAGRCHSIEAPATPRSLASGPTRRGSNTSASSVASRTAAYSTG